jgi:dTDP-4-amino-4,6-dideoxygalactose transaminase
MNAYKIVQDFESAISDYTGAEYAVALDNCTNALFLCLVYWKKYVDESPIITIPKRTYLSVPQSVLHAGCKLQFEDVVWNGIYQLKPTSIFDAAKRFTQGMYIPHTFMCLSFHNKKILKIFYNRRPS